MESLAVIILRRMLDVVREEESITEQDMQDASSTLRVDVKHGCFSTLTAALDLLREIHILQINTAEASGYDSFCRGWIAHMFYNIEAEIKELDRYEPGSAAHQMLSAIAQLQPHATIDKLVESGLVPHERARIANVGAELGISGFVRRTTIGTRVSHALTDSGKELLRRLDNKAILASLDAEFSNSDD
jgi:hypothetical protein